MTSLEVAKMFNKNHATILSGANKIEGFMRFDKIFRKQINNLVNIETIKYN
jgi:chromosomal replication initiation ATPase DnaA